MEELFFELLADTQRRAAHLAEHPLYVVHRFLRFRMTQLVANNELQDRREKYIRVTRIRLVDLFKDVFLVLAFHHTHAQYDELEEFILNRIDQLILMLQRHVNDLDREIGIINEELENDRNRDQGEDEEDDDGWDSSVEDVENIRNEDDDNSESDWSDDEMENNNNDTNDEDEGIEFDMPEEEIEEEEVEEDQIMV